jgi:hypothetical protein
MSTQPAHDRLDIQPFWQVQAVFDPDGTGADFAYTIGLHSRGLPELHIWARPSIGEDPGADWVLSTRDRGEVLNELAGLMMAGRLGVGSEVTHEYDGGHTRVTYRVDPPGTRDELEALGVPEGVDVLPVRWSLHRAPEGALHPLTSRAEEAATSLYDELTVGRDTARRAPRGWKLPTDPCFDTEQPFGPLTPVVLARAAQLWQADDETVVELVRVAAEVRFGYSLTHATTVASAVARPHGRSAALAQLHDRVHELAEAMTTAPAAQGRWRAVCRAFYSEGWDRLDVARRRQVESNLAGLLHDVTLSCLAVEAVADVADETLLLAGLGPWVAGIERQRVPSAAAWEAPTDVLTVIGDLLRPLDAHGLTTLARLHALAMTGRVEGATAYPDLCSRLLSWATVSASVYPRRLLDELPGWGSSRYSRSDTLGPTPPELHAWATCLASALTHRARLSADDVRAFTLLSDHKLPRLAALINSPVPA